MISDQDIKNICELVKNYRSIFLQLPEGLKRKGPEIAKKLNDLGKDVIISGDSCYGACDLRINDAKISGVDAILHIGHVNMGLDCEVPVIFYELDLKLDTRIAELIEKKMNKLDKKRVALISNVQHVKSLPLIKKKLEDRGISVYIPSARGHEKIVYDGQVLGCYYRHVEKILDRIDCIFYVGTGNFHPLGVSLSTDKPVYSIDPYTSKITSMDELKEKILRKRWGRIVSAMDANSFGIIVSSKPGQFRLEYAKHICERLKKKGKDAYIILMDDINNSKLIFNLDAYVVVACPRIVIDDAETFKYPVLSPTELEISLNNEKWNEYRFNHHE
ncbi:MAG: diphthamide biosynthesis enzyme Dph2 [Candidatus Hydrothermarchaeota archaeon]